MTSVFTWRDESGAPCVVIRDALDKDGMSNIIRECKDKVYRGSHVLPDGTLEYDNNVQRNSDVFFFSDKNLYDVVMAYVMTANYEAGWRYDIVDSEQFQFTVYDGKKKQHYDWHTDGQCDHWNKRQSISWHKPEHINLRYTPQANLLDTVRKISVSVVLNDNYEGGSLWFRTLDDKSNLKEVEVKPRAGDMIIFPSFIDHKVSPVTKGIRYSIVAWFGGPPFK